MERLQWWHLLALVVEFVIANVSLAILWIAHANDLRNTLWRIGGEMGWNSNPRLRIYFYANHRQPPEIPVVWAQR